MRYTYKEVQDGQKVWACAYELNHSKESNALKCEPVYGVITMSEKYRGCGWFTKLKANGESCKTIINFMSREYTDTREEAVKLYNELITKKISYMEELIDDMRRDMITE